jgi:hypothetical protein
MGRIAALYIETEIVPFTTGGRENLLKRVYQNAQWHTSARPSQRPPARKVFSHPTLQLT